MERTSRRLQRAPVSRRAAAARVTCVNDLRRRRPLSSLPLRLRTAAAAQEPARFEPGRRVLLDAHNAYPYQGRWADRVDRALATGTPLAIEQDLIWRPAMRRLPRIRSCRMASRSPGRSRRSAISSSAFARWSTRALTAGSREQWPLITLNLDFKDSQPEHFAAIWRVLGDYEDVADNRAARWPIADSVQPLAGRAGARSDRRRSGAADRVSRCGARRISAPPVRRRAARQPPRNELPPLVQQPWSVVEPEGQNKAGEWTRRDDEPLAQHSSMRRISAGLWIRFYTLNGHSTGDGERMGWSPSYNFGSLEAARLRWRAAIAAGVDFIATDQSNEEFAIAKRPFSFR